MALDSWLLKVKTAVSGGLESAKGGRSVGVLAFEIAGLLSKLLQLWQSLADKHVAQLRREATALEGVRKVVSDDDSFLLGLACAEMVEAVRLAARSVSRISVAGHCHKPGLRSFDRDFEEFADTGHDPHCWVLAWKQMGARAKKFGPYIAATAALHKEIDLLSEAEHGLKKLLLQCGAQPTKSKKIADMQQKVFWHRQEVKRLKERSLWNRSFECVAEILARSAFTVLARIKLVFGVGHELATAAAHALPRSLSLSATVHPSENADANRSAASGPLTSEPLDRKRPGRFLDRSAELLKPPPSTLGAAALAVHYANLVVVIEKMVGSPHLIGADARDDLYTMLPASIRTALRARLRGVGFSAADPGLAGEWREALRWILEWLAPLAHNMMRWQSDRSFERQQVAPRAASVLLLQTLHFANQAMTEAAITELLVGLNYIWRFEREMSARPLMQCPNWNGFLNLQSNSSSDLNRIKED